MITRKVDANDPLAGFTFDWIKKLAMHLDRLYVISWQASDQSNLPGNVTLVSLPGNKLLKVFVLQKHLVKILPQVNGLFCHMNPEYTILSAPLAKLFGKRIVSWYTHGTVSGRLKLMEKLANVVLTASPESFRLPSKKVVVAGHGIDVDVFKPSTTAKNSSIVRLVSVGRISPTKDYESMIKAVDTLVKQGHKITLTIIGGAGLAQQQAYYQSLRAMVTKMNLGQRVWFLGPTPHQQIPHHLQQADIFINLSGTGSLDKAILEAMAAGCLILTSNEAFQKILPPELLVERDNPKQLTEKIGQLIKRPAAELEQLRLVLRQQVVEHHDLSQLGQKIINQFH